MGEIRASFHYVGSSPTSSDDWKIAVSTGASWSAARIRMRVGMPSGPDALCGLRSFNNFSTPCGLGFASWLGMGSSLYPVVQKCLL